ncbi:MAG: PAS domain-containing sensor histidine kinase [Bacteroidetes bacterium]|nr:PAS domain-containing sensor histidine kinase [Bacteroidota bacterium]
MNWSIENTNNNSFLNKLNFVLTYIDKAILVIDSNNNIEYANDVFCKLFGFTETSTYLIGTSACELLEKINQQIEQPQNIIEIINQIKANHKQLLKEEEILLKNGAIIAVDYLPMNDDATNPSRLWLFKNISKYRNLQKKSQQQQAFYEKVLNNIPANITIFDTNHKYLFANKNAVAKEDMRNWLIGKDDFDYSLSKNEGFEKAIARRNYFDQSLQTNQTVQFEEKYVNNQGREIYNLQHFYPYFNAEKNVEFIVGYGVDISKIRQNEKLLVRSVETYQKLLNDLDEIVFIIDENNVLQYVNPLWEKVWGKSYYESVGVSLQHFLSEENNQFITTDVAALRKNAETDKIKRIIKVVFDNGEEKHFQYYLRRFYSLYKEELRVSGFMVDITDQVKAQEELMKVIEKERQLSDMKTVFVNMVSHELRTPLSIIQSSAEILELLQQDKSTSQEELQSYTQRIADEVKRLKDLMDELLLISRIEANKVNFNPSEINVTNFVQELITQQYNPWKDGRSLHLETRGTNRLVKADKFMLRHLLTNIIDNAFKYSPNTPEPNIRIFFGNDSWNIVCRDFGIGVPEKDIIDLGTSFKRGANVGDIQGTGLGLVVVRYFVEKHNGKIEYQSTEGQGTVVRLHFPY